ncbi:hypothetical protein CORT_0E01390 [Candida orthopsilosis Co 90-125]|uniref:PIN domain-containing protein n=1 Tax=Candida orthopsilosis (strain 90-125) TaxID=1136231 RepID=H8X6W6_CANO9|nr:hypothetical protein CORT_0E01390 [Candida orthopsilosis Co 90-125]CCG23727.1 hypothetical protein CORT_0E01390 [Candida orthopsilosis Co 90-125]
MAHESNKRSQHLSQTPLAMQGLQEQHHPFSSSNGNNIHGHVNVNNNQSSSVLNSPGTPQHLRYNSNSSNVRTNMRKAAFNHMRTPTPSSYDIPSSPKVNHQNTQLPHQNHSDSSDSNAILDSVAHDVETSTNTRSHSLRSKLAQPLGSNQLQNTDQSYSEQQQQQQSPRRQQQQQQSQQQQQRAMSDEEQQLATKLKETYKNIVNYEEVVQKNCIEITIKINQLTASSNPSMVYSNQLVNQNLSSSLNSNSSMNFNPTRTSELSNDLWTVYHHNMTLLDNYYDFLVTSLKPSSNQTQFKTGKNIVELYKIPRRMWVYGIVGFLEVLKNIMGIFQDHEICACFISHCFNIISNLTDPILEMEGWWAEKLGDLSRMAIALYSSKFIDWKISAEYWYSVSMKTLYGHGKIHYHMCTVQQDNLDALVNISKSVTCRDPFVPTQHYLRLVVENICTQRNILSLLELPIIDFIKIHKVLLSIYNGRNSESTSVENIHDSQLQYGIDLVTRYGLTFGSDSNGYNFFTREIYSSGGMTINDPQGHSYYQKLPPQHPSQIPTQIPSQPLQAPSATNTLEKMNFWFNKGSLFAISNINHLIGFGDAKNPFAKLFELPEALKERKDKKDRKRKSRSVSQSEDIIPPNASGGPSSGLSGGGVDGQSVVAAHLHNYDWFYSLEFINKSVLELSMRILNHYLVGPKQASTGHVIVWLYFLICVGEGVKKYPVSQPMFDWLFKNLFPWESFINYLNSLLTFVKNSPKLCALYTQYLQVPYIAWFCENEFLPEVWKCWGTLWFDFICEKGDYVDVEEAGIKNNNLFDLPVSGTFPVLNMPSDSFDQKSRNQMENDNDERIVRIILLARTLADEYDFGLVRTSTDFKFDQNAYNNPTTDPFAEQFINDDRFTTNSFCQPISPENLTSEANANLTPLQKDEMWFGGLDSHLYEDENLELEDDIIDDDEDDGEDDNEDDILGDEEDIRYDDENDLEKHYPGLPNHNFNQQSGGGEMFYNDAFIGNPTDPLTLGTLNNDDIEGNFGDKIDSNITYVTLDTNIWLKHCGRIFKCVRNGVLKITIPLIVFQELRALRKSAEATIADAATRSVIIIRELYLTREVVPLRFDGTVASDINETIEFENNSNWRSNVDETILHAVNEHDEMGKRLMKGLNMKLSPYTRSSPVANDESYQYYANSINQQQQQPGGHYEQYSQEGGQHNPYGHSHHNPNFSYFKKDAPILNSRMAKLFKYCILITDDRNMRLRAKTIGLTSFQSKWLFSQLETVFADRCID